MMAETGYEGLFDVEFLEDADGNLYFLEVLDAYAETAEDPMFRCRANELGLDGELNLCKEILVNKQTSLKKYLRSLYTDLLS